MERWFKPRSPEIGLAKNRSLRLESGSPMPIDRKCANNPIRSGAIQTGSKAITFSTGVSASEERVFR
jgi:hypothetical protein